MSQSHTLTRCRWFGLVLLLGLLPSLAEACQQYRDVIQDSKGNILIGVTVTVLIADTATSATLYTDNLCATTTPNPVTTDSTGTFSFYVKDGEYTFQFVKAGYTFSNLPRIAIYDPLGENIVTVAKFTTTDLCATGIGAIDQIGSTSITLVVNKPVTCSLNKTVPITLKVQFMGQGLITIASTKTLTFYRPESIIATPDQTIVAGSGTLAFTLGGRIYVGWAGLRGDGSTDNCAPMNKLITWIPVSGATIEFGDGTFNTTCNFTAINKNNVKIVGRGWGETSIIRSAFNTSGGASSTGANSTVYPNAQLGIFSFNGVSNIEVTGLTLRGTGHFNSGNAVSPYAGKIIYAQQTNDLYVHDVIGVGSDNETIYATGGERIRFDHNIVRDGNWAGLNINTASTESDKSFVTNNIIEDTGGGGGSMQLAGKTLTVTGNRITCPTASSAGPVGLDRVQEFIFAHNIIENCNITLAGRSLVDIYNEDYLTVPNGASGLVIGNVFRNNKVAGYVNDTGVLRIFRGADGEITVANNLFSSNCNTDNQAVAAIWITEVTATARIQIDNNQFKAGAVCAGTGNQTVGIGISATATANNVSIGINTFDPDVTTPYVFNVQPKGGLVGLFPVHGVSGTTTPSNNISGTVTFGAAATKLVQLGSEVGTVTAANATEIFTLTAHGLANNTIVHFANTGGALPTNLLATDLYYVITATANTFQVSSTLGGSAFNITSDGTGTNKVYRRGESDATYFITASGNVNETFFVTAKNKTNFTMNSSNAGSTAVVDWHLIR